MRASGVVLFRDNAIFALVDSANQIPELDETNNIGSSGGQSRYQPPVGVFQPKVKWRRDTPGTVGVGDAPVVAPLIDTNGDGVVNERDVPAVIGIAGNNVGPHRLQAMRGDTGALIFDTPAASREDFAPLTNPAVGDLDGDGVPEIVVGECCRGVIHCYNNDGTQRWVSPVVTYRSSPTIADLDGDGKAEILYGTTVFNFDGSIRWNANTPGYIGGGGGGGVNAQASVVADLDLDGTPEIIAGPSAFDRNGNPIWFWQTLGNYPFTLRGTLDRGATTINTPNSAFILVDGYTAVANLDDDPYPEVIVVTDNTNGGTPTCADSLWVFEHDGRIKPGFPICLYQEVINQVRYTLGPPTVADFDGDGQPDIAIPALKLLDGVVQGADVSRQILSVYERDGSLKWRRELTPASSNESTNAATPVAAFDFDGDGAAELVYNDAQVLRIMRGSDGASLYELGVAHTSPVGYPTIADVDNDGSADLIVPTLLSVNGAPQRSGVLVVSDTTGNWRNSRRVWNQWLYHITNVNENGGIPQAQANNWQTFNNSRAQAPIDGVHKLAAPDLTVSRVTINTQNCPAGVGITARIGNGGSLHVAAGQTVNFYSGDPSAGGALIGSRQTTRALYPGEFEDVTLAGVTPPASQVFVTVNEPPVEALTQSVHLEQLPSVWAQASGYCRSCTVVSSIFAFRGFDGSSSTVWVESFSSPGVVVPGNPPFYELHFQFPVNVTSVEIQNANAFTTGFLGGSLSFSNGFNQPIAFDAGGHGSTAFPEQQGISWIRLTGTSARPDGPSLSEFVVAGSYREPQFRIKEGEGGSGNNKAASALVTPSCDAAANQPPLITSAPPIVATTAVAYAYQVQATDPNGDALTYSLGAAPQTMSITAAGLINWTPSDAQIGDQAVIVQVDDGRGGHAEQSFVITVADPPGVNHRPAFTSSPPGSVTIGHAYQYDATAIDPDGDAVVYSMLQSPAGATIEQLSGLLAWTPSASQVGSQFFTLEALDGRGGRTSQSFAVQVEPATAILPPPPQDRDGDGFDETLDCDDNNPNVNPGRPEIPGNGVDDDCNPATPDTLPPNSISCSITTDKRSYGANSLAQLTITLRNQSSTLTLESLQAQAAVTNPGGQQVFGTALSIPPLQPHQLFRATFAMATQTLAPGAYQASFAVAFGATTACGSAALFTIVPSDAQGRALNGDIAASPAEIPRGAAANLNYQVSNVGNVDLSSLNLNIVVVNVTNGLVVQTLTDHTSLDRNQTYANSRAFDSGGADPADYLVVLQAESGGTSQTVGSALLKINPSGGLTISGAVVRHAPTINGNSRVQGSVRQLTGENVTLNGGAAVTGDLLVPGTPTLRKNGNPIIGAVIVGSGASQPTGYTVTLNGNVQLGSLVTRTDPVSLPAVAPPPASTGSRDVILNSPGGSVGDFATLRDLTLNGNAGTVNVPPGAYRNFIANGGTGFVFGVAGSTQPAVYNLRSLTLNGQSRVQVVGPVVITLATGMTVNGSMGNSGNPQWLVLKAASGGVTLNGGSSVNGALIAPSGTVIINGNSILKGSVICDRLTLNGGAVLDAVGDIGITAAKRRQ